MKQGPDMDAVQEQMRPGRITLEGFLGDDQRKLVEVLNENAAMLSSAGVGARELAARMADLRDLGRPGLGTPVEAPGGLQVLVETDRGKLPCPFGDPGLHRKTITLVRNARGEEVSYTDLGIHMLEAHGFLQGLGSPYRIDPVTFARVLGIAE